MTRIKKECVKEKCIPTNAKAAFKVEGMVCSKGCAPKIKTALKTVEGVGKVCASYETKVAYVKYDSTIANKAAMITAINGIDGGGVYTATELTEEECKASCKKDSKDCWWTKKCSKDSTSCAKWKSSCSKDSASCAKAKAECKKKCEENGKACKWDENKKCSKKKADCKKKCEKSGENCKKDCEKACCSKSEKKACEPGCEKECCTKK